MPLEYQYRLEMTRKKLNALLKKWIGLKSKAGKAIVCKRDPQRRTSFGGIADVLSEGCKEL